MSKSNWRLVLSGLAAGAVTGFFGAGGGMVLVPMLEKLCKLPSDRVFLLSLQIMVPICLVSLVLNAGNLPWAESVPYLLGSLLGGLISLPLGKKLSPIWLHRILGGLILLGGLRMLWA